MVTPECETNMVAIFDIISLLLSFISLLKINYFSTIAIVIVGRAITIRRAIQKRSNELMYNNEVKRLNVTTFAIAKLEAL